MGDVGVAYTLADRKIRVLRDSAEAHGQVRTSWSVTPFNQVLVFNFEDHIAAYRALPSFLEDRDEAWARMWLRVADRA